MIRAVYDRRNPSNVPEFLRKLQDESDKSIVCHRCKKDTGNNTQGHYWKWCKVRHTMRKLHMCCPGDCELEEKGEND